MAKSIDYRRQFCTLEEEVKNAIRDLMQSNNLTEIELDNDYESEVLNEDFEPKGNLILKIEWTNNDAIWKR